MLTRIARVIRDLFCSPGPPELDTDKRPVSVKAVAPLVPAARAPDRRGALHGVPDLPVQHVPRPDDLARIRGALLRSERPAVGLTGPTPLGLQGMGGIGKTVLASALVRDRAVRRAFPGGIFWLTLGQDPNLLALMQRLAESAGIGGSFDTPAQARDALADALKSGALSSCLLVLDDVWRAADVRAFDLMQRSRLLVTTRDAGILEVVGAHQERVELLSDELALELIGRRIGRPQTEWLREDGFRLARAAGHLPLALALAAALIAERRPWDEVAGALEEGRLHYFDPESGAFHPAASVFASMQLSVSALPAADRERLLELSVFPEDLSIPVATIDVLWRYAGSLSQERTLALLRSLRNRSLLSMSDNQSFVRLHDLQRDYLRLVAEEPAALHARLLDAHRSTIPSGQWADLPQDHQYLWEHIAEHMIAADRGAELETLLLDVDWLEAKIRAAGPAAVVSDCLRMPGGSEPLVQVRRAVGSAAHILRADARALPALLVSQMLRSGWRGDRITAAMPGLDGVAPRLRHPLQHGLGEATLALEGHTSGVNGCAVTPDGRRAVSASGDGTLRVWDLESGTSLRTLEGHTGPVYECAVTPDGRRGVSASDDHTLRVWDLESGASLRTLEGGPVYECAVTPDGRRAVSTSDNNRLRVWDLESGASLRTLVGHTGPVNGCAVTPDGRRAVSASGDRTLRVWDLESGASLRTLEGHTSGVGGCAVTPDGRRAVSASWDNTLRVWDLESEAPLRTLDGHTRSVNGCAVTPDGRRAVSASDDCTLRVWGMENGASLRTLVGHTGPVNGCAVTPDGRRAVSASDDRTLRVWDLESGASLRTLEGHTGRVLGCAVTPDGRRAVSASADYTLRVWDLASGVSLRTLAGHTDSVRGCAVTPDGRRAVSASDDGTLRVWDLESGALLETIYGVALFLSVALSDDVICAGDQLGNVWMLEAWAGDSDSSAIPDGAPGRV